MSHPWIVRAQLAVSLLKLAQQLTTNDLGWGIYMLDVSFANFAVSGDGRVKLVDVEHVLVVDFTNHKATISSELTLLFRGMKVGSWLMLSTS